MSALLIATALLSWPGRITLPAPRIHRRSRRRLGGRRIAVAAGVIVVVSAMVLISVAVRSVAVGIALLAAVATGLRLVGGTLRERRRRRFRTEAMQAVRTLARELASGGGLADAVEVAGRTCGSAARPLVDRLGRVGRFGIDGSEPIPAAAPEDDHLLGASLGSAIQMSRQYGIPLAGLVSRIADGIDEQLAAADQRASAVAGARLSGYLLAGLPAVGMLLGAGMGANPLPVLIGGGLGSAMLLAGVALTCLGLIWSARIAR